MQDRVDEMLYRYWLFRGKGLGNRAKIELIGIFQYASEIYIATDRELQLRGLLKPKQIEAIKSMRETIKLDDYYKLEEKGVRFVSYEMDDYPPKLRYIHNPPFALLYIGKLPSENCKAVAIVGARMCSNYGRYLAEEFSKYLAEKNIQIISGLAKGIDGIGQASAVEAGGNTFAVLGCGVDICYPSENRRIYEKIKTSGGIISEFDIGTEPLPNYFPARNRIISGLSDAILVIEAKEKSGSLITVDFALEQGKDVYAIPGRIVDSLSYGCNYLIKQGAQIVISPKDLYSELCPFVKKKDETQLRIEIHSEVETRLLDILDDVPKTVDEIREAYNTNYDEKTTNVEIITLLTKLVLREEVSQISGNLFLRRYSSKNIMFV